MHVDRQASWWALCWYDRYIRHTRSHPCPTTCNGVPVWLRTDLGQRSRSDVTMNSQRVLGGARTYQGGRRQEDAEGGADILLNRPAIGGPGCGSGVPWPARGEAATPVPANGQSSMDDSVDGRCPAYPAGSLTPQSLSCLPACSAQPRLAAGLAGLGCSILPMVKSMPAKATWARASANWPMPMT